LTRPFQILTVGIEQGSLEDGKINGTTAIETSPSVRRPSSTWLLPRGPAASCLSTIPLQLPNVLANYCWFGLL
jgi:hypothetical protein